MATFYVTPDQIPGLLAKHRERMPKAIRKAQVRSAILARTDLVRATPVDTAHMKNAWTVVDRLGLPPAVDNDAPHAGIIERGARPHPVSREGLEAIAAWVKRKLLTKVRPAGPVQRGKGGREAFTRDWAEKAAMDIARRIAWKIQRFGQKGHFLVEKRLEKFTKVFVRELHVEIERLLAEGA